MPGSASSAVDKALDLLEAIADSDRPQRLSELAARVGLHRATAHRVLVDLVARGWVLRAGDHYLPGPAQLQAVRRRRPQLPRHPLPTRDGVAVRARRA